MARAEVSQVTPDRAAAAMRAAGLRAAMPWDTPEAIAASGDCFEFRTERGALVFVTHVRDGVLFIDAAASQEPGAGMTGAGLALAEAIAHRVGAREIAFQTVRPGLVRLAKQDGYEVAGYIMKKALQ